MATKQKQADEWFSKYVRLRDADKNGVIRCCACGRLVAWQDADASHFVSRQYLHTRYNEKNVHASCRQCNRFLEGHKEGYSVFLARKYGKDIFEELYRDKDTPYWGFPYEKIIEEYKQKFKDLQTKVATIIK